MIDYKEKMLRLLVEKYRKSKKDSKTNVICRRTSISPSELYKKYSKNDGDMEQIETINQAAAQCAGEGFLTFEERDSATKLQSFI